MKSKITFLHYGTLFTVVYGYDYQIDILPS